VSAHCASFCLIILLPSKARDFRAWIREARTQLLPAFLINAVQKWTARTLQNLYDDVLDGEKERYWPDLWAGRTVSVILPSCSNPCWRADSQEMRDRLRRTAHLSYWFAEVTRVSETANNDRKNLEELKTQRNLLYNAFLKNPMYTWLAVEIKVLDDQLAEWTQRMNRKC